MTTEKRFHPFLALRFLRKTLAVYLLPLINVLFERNWSALWTALQQDLIIFSLMAGISWVILNASSWSLDDHDVLHIHWKLFFRFSDRTGKFVRFERRQRRTVVSDCFDQRS